YLPEVGEIAVTGEGYGIHGRIQKDQGELDADERAAVSRLVRAGTLASETALRFLPDGTVTLLGDSVDAAFHVLLHKCLAESDRELPEVVAIVPYEPAHRYSAAYFVRGEQTRVAVKGAFETIIEMCRDAGDAWEQRRRILT